MIVRIEFNDKWGLLEERSELLRCGFEWVETDFDDGADCYYEIWVDDGNDTVDKS